MGFKIRLVTMSFLQFFVWGAWLITIGGFWFQTKGWSPIEFGAIFATMGISSIFMPALMGMVADRWVNSERLYGVLHILYGSALMVLPGVNDPRTFFWVMMLAMIFYMPTIALSNSISYSVLKSKGLNVVKAFPPIRVFGTVGFIVAMWIVNLTGYNATIGQFYLAAGAAFVLGVYAFTLPASPPLGKGGESRSLVQILGLNAFSLFRNRNMALFFIFSLFLGAALQLTNMYGEPYLKDFATMPEYADSFVVKYSTITLSISQISETLFILAIPFVLRRFGIKVVMLTSLVAWILRFALLGLGNPAEGLWMIILSCVVYGMAFDFFNISGSLYSETRSDAKIRSSAQGLFMMMTNGIGAVVGGWASGAAIELFFTLPDGSREWQGIWFAFAGYALVITLLFAILFRDDKPVLAE